MYTKIYQVKSYKFSFGNKTMLEENQVDTTCQVPNLYKFILKLM